MRSPLKAMLITGSLVAASLGASASATAAPPAPPTLITSHFACGNGVCEVGPGNVGIPFAAGLDGTGGPTYTGPECNPYTMKVISGSLSPGLQFGEPVCEWTVTGTPTQAGTYAFTVQITPQPNNLGQIPGPSGTQQLTITIGTGGSDRPVVGGRLQRAPVPVGHHRVRRQRQHALVGVRDLDRQGAHLGPAELQHRG